MDIDKLIDKEKIKKVVDEVAKEVEPNQELKERLKKVEQLISERLKSKGLKFVIGGSYARDTWLPEEPDIDFFVLYDQSLGAEKIGKKATEELVDIVKDLNYWLNYAEHPYVEGVVDGVKFNLVPCADTNPGNWITSMDRSRFHNEYLKERLNENLKKEIRVFKKFLKSNELYGAEIKVGGLSGYVSEILILKYGSFDEALKNIVKWQKGEVISLEPYHYDPKKVFNTEVIILDPVDEKRNLASAIKNNVLAKLKVISLEFLINPDKKFFYRREILAKDEIAGNVLIVSFKVPNFVEDIRWGMYYRAQEAMSNALKSNGFNVIRSTINEDENNVSFAFFLEFNLRMFERRAGPPVYYLDNVLKFVSSHDIVWAENDMRLYSYVKSKTPDAKDVLYKMTQNPTANGIPKQLSFEFKNAKIFYYNEISSNDSFYNSAKGAYSKLFDTLT